MSNRPNASRDFQLSLFDPGCVIQQDQELIDVIVNGNYKQAIGYGDVDFFKNYITLVDQGPVDLGICILNHSFSFDVVVDQINQLIQNHMAVNGLFYLSINKYLARPDHYDLALPADYDSAIQQFVTDRINYKIEKYLACGNDQGNKFNWVHPLTRFYIRT